MFSIVCFISIVGIYVFYTLEWALDISILYIYILYIYIRKGSMAAMLFTVAQTEFLWQLKLPQVLSCLEGGGGGGGW